MERLIEATLCHSRWLLVPMYLGLCALSIFLTVGELGRQARRRQAEAPC